MTKTTWKKKQNYRELKIDCCANCIYRIRNEHWELFCHIDNGELDFNHIVVEYGICDNYKRETK